MGTPRTGRVVFAASTPGRCAAPPAPPIITRSPRSSSAAACSKNRSGVRWAEMTRVSKGTPKSAKTSAARRIIGQSLALPISIPTSGESFAEPCAEECADVCAEECADVCEEDVCVIIPQFYPLPRPRPNFLEKSQPPVVQCRSQVAAWECVSPSAAWQISLSFPSPAPTLSFPSSAWECVPAKLCFATSTPASAPVVDCIPDRNDPPPRQQGNGGQKTNLLSSRNFHSATAE